MEGVRREDQVEVKEGVRRSFLSGSDSRKIQFGFIILSLVLVVRWVLSSSSRAGIQKRGERELIVIAFARRPLLPPFPTSSFLMALQIPSKLAILPYAASSYSSGPPADPPVHSLPPDVLVFPGLSFSIHLTSRHAVELIRSLVKVRSLLSPRPLPADL